uniref:Uncharacterized protein n=1 Tax=Candidatus Kentrum sp. LPFa TaxID=2126335 RepID=A0A450WM44_9GAMM|nr:MAG: hypothetical protein BECKLPF1236B_GA0070989_113311 [Candidatus Kentron sp. LPFa]
MRRFPQNPGFSDTQPDLTGTRNFRLLLSRHSLRSGNPVINISLL